MTNQNSVLKQLIREIADASAVGRWGLFEAESPKMDSTPPKVAGAGGSPKKKQKVGGEEPAAGGADDENFKQERIAAKEERDAAEKEKDEAEEAKDAAAKAAEEADDMTPKLVSDTGVKVLLSYILDVAEKEGKLDAFLAILKDKFALDRSSTFVKFKEDLVRVIDKEKNQKFLADIESIRPSEDSSKSGDDLLTEGGWDADNETPPDIDATSVGGLKNTVKDWLWNSKWKGLVDLGDFRDDFEVAMYWVAYNYHDGQWGDLYSILSTSPYKPGRFLTAADEESELVQDLYADIISYLESHGKI